MRVEGSGFRVEGLGLGVPGGSGIYPKDIISFWKRV